MNMVRKLPVLAATLAAATTLGAGGMVLSSGTTPAYASVRPAAAAARPNTTVSISQSGTMNGATDDHVVSCVLKNSATGAGVNGDVITLDRNGQNDHTATTSDGGIVALTVTVNKGASATFQCVFPGNRSFVESSSRVITVTTS
jgi:hypothetical protein